MSLLFIESFDTGSGGNAFQKWAANVGGSTTTGRTGTNAFVIGGGGNNLDSPTFAPGTTDQGVIGFAFKYTGPAAAGGDFLRIREGSTIHLTLQLDASGHIVVTRNGTVLATSTGVLVSNSWYYVEFKWKIHDTTGTYDVKVDESATGWPSGSGADTRNGGSGVWDNFWLLNGNSGNAIFDDLYLCDLSGSINNTFLGDTKVEVRNPQTDGVAAGSNAQFSLSTGTDHGALVDETDPNDDTDYVFDNVAGHRDSYNYPSTTLSGTVRGVCVTARLKKTDAGARTVKTMARSGGSNFDHATAISPTTGYLGWPQIWETDPNTSAAWTISNFNAAEFGLKIET